MGVTGAPITPSLSEMEGGRTKICHRRRWLTKKYGFVVIRWSIRGTKLRNNCIRRLGYCHQPSQTWQTRVLGVTGASITPCLSEMVGARTQICYPFTLIKSLLLCTSQISNCYMFKCRFVLENFWKRKGRQLYQLSSTFFQERLKLSQNFALVMSFQYLRGDTRSLPKMS